MNNDEKRSIENVLQELRQKQWLNADRLAALAERSLAGEPIDKEEQIAKRIERGDLQIAMRVLGQLLEEYEV